MDQLKRKSKSRSGIHSTSLKKKKLFTFLWLYKSFIYTIYLAFSIFIISSIFLQYNVVNLTSSSDDDDLKIYIYDLPSNYNSDWLTNERCSRHLFASEVAIHRALLSSGNRTLDPTVADFFFVPVYVSCNFSTVNGFPTIGHARELLSTAVDFVSSSLPFWNRSNGSDHVFVASHDFGSCFNTFEDVAMKAGVPQFMKNSVILQTFGVKYEHPCQSVENVVIPPYISPASVQSTLVKFPIDDRRRDIFAFFRGKMERHPKNISGRFYSKELRTKIWKHFKRNRRFYLHRHNSTGYLSEIARSVFCLCPRGWAPWSPRLVESVALGCVPVIIADGIQLPFPETVRWPEISLTVAENDVREIGRILDHVSRTNLTVIQRNLQDKSVRRALLFYDAVQEGDATWHVLQELAQKLGDAMNRAVEQRNLKKSLSISTTQKDITTPLTTVPTITFPTTSASPVLNPTTIPDSPVNVVPFNTPNPSSTVNPGASWCIASQTAENNALQIALDYACGLGRADCAGIQPSGNCYYPNTIREHASYAFNNYYQKNPLPNSCNFGGTAIITSTDPSSATCQYPSTSTSSSILNTSNQNRSTIFGVGPSGPVSSTATSANKVQHLWSTLCFLLLLLWRNNLELL